jgi:iron complex outermembrane receptor protein
MMNETILARSMRLMFSSSIAVGLGLLAQPAIAQETTPASDSIARVEVTGSSIKRINREGALPVQILSRAAIDQSGANNVADLVAALPAMQGFITASSSVNGGGGGAQTASVHAIGTSYTLVLLNGRRMAPYNTGSAVNLATIPLSAVERVEILTDGASTLYGSDAIAGVVNFILKKNQTALALDATLTRPQESGGASSNFSISKGFGTLADDGFNVLLAYSRDEQKDLNARQRDFTRSGSIPFDHNGKLYALYYNSINSIPGNVRVDAGADNATFNPSLKTSGKCGAPNTFRRGEVCRYDFAATLNLLPQQKRDSFFASFNAKLNESTTVFGEAVLSNFSSIARYAPPAQPLNIISTDPVTGVRSVNQNYLALYNKWVVPQLAGYGIDPARVNDVNVNLRLADAGGRTDAWKTETRHLVLGVEGRLKGWDYATSLTHSQNTQRDDALAGYVSAVKFEELVKNGTYDFFDLQPNAASALSPAVLRQNLGVTDSKIDVASARASSELFATAGGMAQLGVGADFTRQQYADHPSAISQGPNRLQPDFADVIVGGSTGAMPFDTTRKNWGGFAELLVPLMKNFDLTGAVRYDSYEAARNAMNFDVDGNLIAPAEQGNTASKSTYKLALRYQPTSALMLRGSYGTGFKAPSLSDITSPLAYGGSSDFHPCPIKDASDPRFPYCRGVAEYDLLSGGNALRGEAGLRPEESRQGALGVRVEPNSWMTLGVDFWDVKLTNQIQRLPQELVFRDPAYNQYISLYYHPIQKSKVLVGTLTPINLARSHYQGIDWDHSMRTSTPMGKLSVNWTGTYMLKAEKEVPGKGGESSVGRFDTYNDVTFRIVSRLTAALQTGRFNNAVTLNYRSGYHDQVIKADNYALVEVNPDGSPGAFVGMTRDVKSYLTVDLQSKATLMKNFSLTAGVRNVLDQDPPLTIRLAGGGDQQGYDGRYADPLGRTFYLTGAFKF